MKRIIAVFLLFLTLSAGGYAADKKADKKTNDIAEVKASIEGLRQEIKDLKMLLGAFIAGVATGVDKFGQQGRVANIPPQGAPSNTPPVPQEATTTIGYNPILGDKNAPITIVEFSDYECPFCARFYSETLKQLKKEYIDPGKVRFAYRDFPLPFHQNARKAALAVSCAGEQKKYWEMHNAVFENQQSIADIDGIAKQAGLDVEKLNKCIESKKYDADIEKDINDGRTAGIGGTPSFIIGKSLPDGSVQGKFIPGALPFGAFKAEIDALLKQ